MNPTAADYEKLARTLCTAQGNEHRMTRHAGGGWLYRGYLLARPEQENGTISREWDICEDTPGGWVACDRLATRWECVEAIDRSEGPSR